MFPKLVALHQTNGLDLGSTYSNDQACRIFITAIASCFFEELQQSLKSARFFSIMSDSSVDRSVKDQELIYCAYLQNGKPVNQLIQIVALDHANSQGILDAILAGLLKVGVGEGDLKKRLVGLGCDGASVMLGVNNGVTARLQRLCPSLVPICDGGGWTWLIHRSAHPLSPSRQPSQRRRHQPLHSEPRRMQPPPHSLQLRRWPNFRPLCWPHHVPVPRLNRPSAEAQLLQVQLKRNIKYKGYQHFYTVNMKNVIAGLTKLKETHPQYSDVGIDESATFESLQGDRPVDEEDAKQDNPDAAQPEEPSNPDGEMETTADATDEQQPSNMDKEKEDFRPGLALDTCICSLLT
ncbi:hypothetical protein AAFF_G00324500 [Aldrovandia affinis]|uniref:DUF4371 domain-containing protein n=1 Tax=Aldrovandia affinis TaxID=143900 RepID=A0AAD7R7A4_9TELE|nr:hypothetical protein AAFF_G00324500 [Aldrovandia affinis]